MKILTGEFDVLFDGAGKYCGVGNEHTSLGRHVSLSFGQTSKTCYRSWCTIDKTGTRDLKGSWFDRTLVLALGQRELRKMGIEMSLFSKSAWGLVLNSVRSVQHKDIIFICGSEIFRVEAMELAQCPQLWRHNTRHRTSEVLCRAPQKPPVVY